MKVNDVLREILTTRPVKRKGRYKNIYELVFDKNLFDNVDFLQYYTKDINFQYLCKNYQKISIRRYKQKILRLQIIDKNMMHLTLNVLNEIYPNYIAQMITSVMPITASTSNIFTLKPKLRQE